MGLAGRQVRRALTATGVEAEYEITRDDLFAFQWRAAFTSPSARRRRWKVYATWFLALLLFAIVPAIGADGFAPSRINFIFLLTGFPLVAFLQWLLERRLMRGAILGLVGQERPEGGQLGRHRVELSDGGLLERTAVGESRISWAGVDRVEEDPHYIYIYTSVAAAHVVPKRAFAAPSGAEAFLLYARDRLGKR